MVNWSGILEGVEAAIPVAAKAYNVFKKKPKAVQAQIIQADPSLGGLRRDNSASMLPAGLAGMGILPFLALAGVVWFANRRK